MWSRVMLTAAAGLLMLTGCGAVDYPASQSEEPAAAEETASDSYDGSAEAARTQDNTLPVIQTMGSVDMNEVDAAQKVLKAFLTAFDESNAADIWRYSDVNLMSLVWGDGEYVTEEEFIEEYEASSEKSTADMGLEQVSFAGLNVVQFSPKQELVPKLQKILDSEKLTAAIGEGHTADRAYKFMLNSSELEEAEEMYVIRLDGEWTVDLSMCTYVQIAMAIGDVERTWNDGVAVNVHVAAVKAAGEVGGEVPDCILSSADLSSELASLIDEKLGLDALWAVKFEGGVPVQVYYAGKAEDKYLGGYPEECDGFPGYAVGDDLSVYFGYEDWN